MVKVKKVWKNNLCFLSCLSIRICMGCKGKENLNFEVLLQTEWKIRNI